MVNKQLSDSDDSTNRRQFIKMGSVGTATLLAGCIGGESNGGGGITVGAAPSGSTMYNTWQGILRAVEESDTDLDLTIQETAGGEANLRQYEKGQIDIGGGSLHDINQVMEQEGPYEEEPVDKLALQAFRYAVMYLYGVAADGSGIETYDDLRDDDVTVWPIAPGTSVRAFTNYLWSLPDIDLWDNINRSDIAPDDIAGAVEEGRVDAVIVYNSGQVFLPDYYQQIEARADLHSIQMGDEMNSALSDEGVLTEDFGPVGFEQDMDSTDAWTLNFQIAFGDTVSEEDGKELTEIIIENIDTVQDAQAAFPDSPEGMTEAIIADERLPVHPGVAEAYKEYDVFDDSWSVGMETDY